MNWLQRLRAVMPSKDQRITLELEAREWAQLREWAKSYDWTPAEMVTIWIRNRMHGTGRVGN